MDVTISQKGPGLDAVIDRQIRRLTQASRTAGRDVAKDGAKAIKDHARGQRGTLSFGGKQIGVRTKTAAQAAGATVTLDAKPAGAWAIINDGAKPHAIAPRRAKALAYGGRFAAHVSHPGTAGTGIWDNSEGPLTRAIVDTVEDACDEALEV